MIVIALLAIIATIAIPSYTQFVASNNVSSVKNELLGVITHARGMAVTNRQKYALSFKNSELGLINDVDSQVIEHFAVDTSKISIIAKNFNNKDLVFNSQGMAWWRDGTFLTTEPYFLICSKGSVILGSKVKIKSSGTIYSETASKVECQNG